jgi:hypothetical protein
MKSSHAKSSLLLLLLPWMALLVSIPSVTAQATFAHLVVFNNNEEEVGKTCSEFDWKRVTDAIINATTTFAPTVTTTIATSNSTSKFFNSTNSTNTTYATNATTVAYATSSSTSRSSNQPGTYTTMEACNHTVPSIHAALDRFIAERSLATPCLSLLGSTTNLTSRRVECVPTSQDCDVSYVSLYTLPTPTSSTSSSSFKTSALLSASTMTLPNMPRSGTKICLTPIAGSRTGATVPRLVTFAASMEFFYGDVHFSLSHTPPKLGILPAAGRKNWTEGQVPYFMLPNQNTTRGYMITGHVLLPGTYVLTIKSSYAPDMVTSITFTVAACIPGRDGGI